ncbi:hypothetical protein, partial [uncultured Sutterella sp.]|uniref:hypothetical protein n=1 Tax=uncultured Sutterella sp. TaxID=286133 RepID=UPI00266ED263
LWWFYLHKSFINYNITVATCQLFCAYINIYINLIGTAQCCKFTGAKRQRGINRVRRHIEKQLLKQLAPKHRTKKPAEATGGG